jgi:prevent-host-death family protein
MDIKTTLPISEARKRIFKIAEDVQKPNTHYTLTENGRPKAVMMSAQEFESWQETLEVTRDFPDLKKDVERVERDVRSGAYRKYATLEEVMARYGFVLKEKSNVNYAVGDKIRKKSRERSRKNSRTLPKARTRHPSGAGR